MDDQAKQKINNIAELVKKNKTLKEELANLGDYKDKIEKTKQHYAGDIKKGGGTKSK